MSAPYLRSRGVYYWPGIWNSGKPTYKGKTIYSLRVSSEEIRDKAHGPRLDTEFHAVFIDGTSENLPLSDSEYLRMLLDFPNHMLQIPM